MCSDNRGMSSGVISMLSCLGGRGERARRVEAEAERLLHDYGELADSVERQREDEASPDYALRVGGCGVNS